MAADSVGTERHTRSDEAHRPGPDPAAEVRILGPLEVESGGTVRPVTSLRQRKLLAVLVVNANATVPLDRLVDVLWDDPPVSARQQIHNVVGAVRRTLSGVPGIQLVTSSSGYEMAVPETRVDALRFQAEVHRADRAAAAGDLDEAVRLLSDALALWRGPALAGLTGRHLAGVAIRLEERRLSATEQLFELRLRRGEASGLVGELMQLVAEHPLRESLRSTLMVALHRSGRQADGLAVFDEGRRVLADELGLDPSPALKALQQQILQGDPPAGSAPEAVPPDPAPAPARGPCYLPYDIADFTGRAEEMRQLSEAVSAHTSPGLALVAIDGMGGVGKTTVAVHLAHRVAERYPDGQFFVDLHGFTPGVEALSATQALDTLLRDAGVPTELIPSDLAGRSALWRARTAGKATLLVLDNAVEAEQVRPLLPGTAGSLVLVTSRRKLTALDGSVPLSLGTLSAADAVELFAAIVGGDRVEADPEAAAAAVERCGRLPVAVRIAAARLRDRRSWTVAHLVRQLEDREQRGRQLAVGDRSVLAVLGLSYRYLSAEHARVFRLASLHPGPDFDAYAVAALADLSLDRAETALEALFEDNLLLQPSPQRYQFHDLIHESARELSERHDGERSGRAARHRVLDYYLRSAHSWCAPIAKGCFAEPPVLAHEPRFVKAAADDQEAIRHLCTEQRNLVRAVRCADEHGLDATIWQLTCAVQPYLQLQNYGAEAAGLFESALRAARRTRHARGESACLAGLALVLRARGHNAEARALLQEAVELSRRTGHRHAESYQLADLGITYLNDYRFDDAHASFRAAHAIALAEQDRQALADLVNNLGVVSRDMGRLDEAYRYFENTLDLDQESNSRPSQVLTLDNIGGVLHMWGRYREARARFEDALDLARSVGGCYGESLALVGLCMTHRSLGDLAGARGYGRSALELTRSAGLFDVEWEALNHLGDVLVSLGDLAQAEELFVEAGDLARRHGSSRYVARAHEGLAHVALARGDVAAASTEWDEALTAFPSGVVETESVRRHLQDIEDRTVTCRRCDIAFEAVEPTSSCP